jgi:hypothetical protein
MPEHYRNFNVAIYTRAYEVREMANLDWLRQRFDVMSSHLKINRVYLETHRDGIMVDEKTLLQAKEFFAQRGVLTSGGITYTVNERNRFETYCYTRPESRQKVRDIAEFTARWFDDFILDDFFFTDCKCPACIAAKGDQSWTEFRLKQMAAAGRDLVIAPARAVNPKVKVTIKYPNWYEHFQGLGFNLEQEPKDFDFLYTGTETRDPVRGNQHLPQYESYLIFRYFEAVKPGCNQGGWVDPFGSFYLDRYAEQLWLTAFAKAPEVTLFDFRSIQRPIMPTDRAVWQDAAWQGSALPSNRTSFDFDEMIAPECDADGKWPENTPITLAAGYAFEKVDAVLGQLGNPIGIKSYRPYHATGEDFLHNFLGMLGIPIDLVPEFPEDAQTVLLTESACHDAEIVDKIKQHLMKGKNVFITSGLLKATQGISDIVELRIADQKALVKEFQIGWFQYCKIDEPILIPQIHYLTNDSWEEISCLGGYTGYPLLHSARYGNGVLYVLVIPDNFSDLFKLPAEVLTKIKELMMKDFYVSLEGPAQVAMFVYDNDTFIVESFLPETSAVQLVLAERFTQLIDLVTGEVITGEMPQEIKTPFGSFNPKPGKRLFQAEVKPHSFRAFRCEA